MGNGSGFLRILAVGDVWQGSNATAFFSAFRRLGHSVFVVSPENYIPSAWSSIPLRAMRRALEPAFVREFSRAVVRESRDLDPHLFFVFKGRHVTAQTVDAVRDGGALAVNFYPDVSFFAHGSHIPKALQRYDWVFTTKSFGVADMKRELGVTAASLLPHGFDPDVHRRVELTDEDMQRYACDVSFIGTWSPKKQDLLERVAERLPGIRMRIWGSQWEQARATLGTRIEGRHVLGAEYAKAIVASKINLAILSEARSGSSSGDLITSRTFQIPATGSFMLHERTVEVLSHFAEGKECACFDTPDELTSGIEYFLGHDDERRAIAAGGRLRSVESDYSVDNRAASVVAKVRELQQLRQAGSGTCDLP